ncbi:hypothetical protein Golob_023416, partial [Gossypium lobatum]|nr:hypothetical protein [Gossypium lobatum]
ALNLIEDGLIWHIGGREVVNIWNDPWPSGPRNTRVSINSINPYWITVSQLIDKEIVTWKKAEILDIFSSNQVERIFKIPFSCIRLNDILVWRHEVTGEYTVKSWYKVLVSEHLHSANKISTATPHIYKEFYNSLWKLQLPKTIKIHVWRLFNDFLPYFSNLAKCRLIRDVLYPLCKDPLEDANHLSRNC